MINLKEATNDLEELLVAIHEKQIKGKENDLITTTFAVLDRYVYL